VELGVLLPGALHLLILDLQLGLVDLKLVDELQNLGRLVPMGLRPLPDELLRLPSQTLKSAGLISVGRHARMNHQLDFFKINGLDSL
jgi:hypothetical protein